MSELKVFIKTRPWDDGVDLYFIEERADGKRSIVKPVQFEMETLKESQMIETPTLRLNGMWGRQLLQAFSEALQKEGIKPESDSKLEGKLLATEYHLEDMRELLELSSKNK